MPEQWRFDLLKKNTTEKARERRGQLARNLFTADPQVDGARILLLDDTFTTGGTMASAAFALKERGATCVVGLSFGRQLGSDWNDNKELISTLPDRDLIIGDCVVHNKGRAHFGAIF
ncbi:phosphoribosyltransferase family protein [Streptomyces rochei]|uniref:phosphoribosyltransferase family protein n=1 Tax=Streptomyces rochei TaxID=1928 RepID=UPI00369741A9